MRSVLSASYLTKNDLPDTVERLNARLSPCRVCPRACGVDRSPTASRNPGHGDTSWSDGRITDCFQADARPKDTLHPGTSLGACRTGYLPKVASCNLHFGEEPPISGTKGSGTIFFSGCPLRCVFCQNYPISQLVNGNEMSIETLAEQMLLLQKRGAHNINFVTPTHFVPQMVEAISVAAGRGLSIPIVYNSSGYEELETLRLLNGVVDVYLPDMKYGDDGNAVKYTSAPGYVTINRAAVAEMYRQVGDLQVDENGIARRGLIVRHLVLPGNVSGTEKVIEFLASLSPTITISLMSQYFPAHRAPEVPELSGKLTEEEYETITDLLDSYGLENGWIQPLGGESRE